MTDVDEFKQKKKEFKAKAKDIAEELDKCEYTSDTGTPIFIHITYTTNIFP